MTNKKQTLKGVIIYLLITFGIACLTGIFPFTEAAKTNTFTKALAAICCFVMTFSPAIGAALTRIINKEGFKDMRFRLNFKKNGKYYLAAILIPIVYGILNNLIVIPIYKDCLSPNLTEDIPMKLIMLIFYSSISVIYTVMYLGEELGWRDYLYPRLEELMGTPAAMLVGGIIWGLWHVPSYAAQGMGFVEFCFFAVFTIAFGCFLHWLTRRTNSIYPACIAHAMNNNATAFLSALFFMPEKLAETQLLSPWGTADFLGVIPILIVGIISLILLMKKKKAE